MRISSKDTAKGEFGKDKDKGSGLQGFPAVEPLALHTRLNAAGAQIEKTGQEPELFWRIFFWNDDP